MAAITSSALVARIVAGDQAAEEELVHRYSRGVAAVLRQATGDRCISEDLSQDTFALVIEKLRRGELRDPERLPGFICGIARNLALSYFRTLRRQNAGANALAGSSAPPEPNPMDQVLLKERAEIVRQVLAELPTERDREILFRFYLQEEDKDMICNELKLDSLHFNRVLHRARQRYKELYQERNARRTTLG